MAKANNLCCEASWAVLLFPWSAEYFFGSFLNTWIFKLIFLTTSWNGKWSGVEQPKLHDGVHCHMPGTCGAACGCLACSYPSTWHSGEAAVGYSQTQGIMLGRPSKDPVLVFKCLKVISSADYEVDKTAWREGQCECHNVRNTNMLLKSFAPPPGVLWAYQ